MAAGTEGRIYLQPNAKPKKLLAEGRLSAPDSRTNVVANGRTRIWRLLKIVLAYWAAIGIEDGSPGNEACRIGF